MFYYEIPLWYIGSAIRDEKVEYVHTWLISVVEALTCCIVWL